MHSALGIAILIQLCWQTQRTPFSAKTVIESTLSVQSSLKMVNGSNGWALGDQLLHTEDGGKSWQGAPPSSARLLISPSWGILRDGRAWYLGSKSTTSGEMDVLDFVRYNGRMDFDISPRPLPCSEALQCAAMDFDADGMIGVLATREQESFETGRLQIYVTRDGGSHWTPSRVALTSVGSREPVSARMLGNQRAMVVAGCRVFEVAIAADKEARDVRVPEPCDGWNTPFSFREAGGRFWLRTFRGDIYFRESSGTVWHRFAYGTNGLPVPREYDEWVSFYTHAFGVVVRSGKGYATTNGGRKWDMIQTQPSEVLLGVSCFNIGCLVRSNFRFILVRDEGAK